MIQDVPWVLTTTSAFRHRVMAWDAREGCRLVLASSMDSGARGDEKRQAAFAVCFSCGYTAHEHLGENKYFGPRSCSNKQEHTSLSGVLLDQSTPSDTIMCSCLFKHDQQLGTCSEPSACGVMCTLMCDTCLVYVSITADAYCSSCCAPCQTPWVMDCSLRLRTPDLKKRLIVL